MAIWTFLNPLNWFRRKQNGLRVTLRANLYEGDLHPVVDVEGIGPEYGRRLAEVGILNTDQLLAHPAAAVAAAVGTQPTRVRTWQAMAELAVVDGIGPQYAEALARGGVTGIGDLVARDARLIADEVNEHLSSLGTTVTGGKVSETRVRTWQEAATTMTRRRVTVRLFGETLPPVSKQARRDAAEGRATAAATAPTRASGRTTTRNGASGSRSTRTAGATAGTVRSTTKTSTPKTAKAPAGTAKACAALTAAGTACKRVARDGSKYCASHKGFRAPAKATGKTTTTRKTASKTTATTATTTSRSAARKTTTKPATRATGNGKAGAANGAAKTGRVHVTHNGYRLYQKGNRFYFSKKTQAQLKQDGAEPVYELPRDREVKVTQNGLPVLKSK